MSKNEKCEHFISHFAFSNNKLHTHTQTKKQKQKQKNKTKQNLIKLTNYHIFDINNYLTLSTVSFGNDFLFFICFHSLLHFYAYTFDT